MPKFDQIVGEPLNLISTNSWTNKMWYSSLTRPSNHLRITTTCQQRPLFLGPQDSRCTQIGSIHIIWMNISWVQKSWYFFNLHVSIHNFLNRTKQTISKKRRLQFESVRHIYEEDYWETLVQCLSTFHRFTRWVARLKEHGNTCSFYPKNSSHILGAFQ